MANDEVISVRLARSYTYALAKSAATNTALLITMDRLPRRYVEWMPSSQRTTAPPQPPQLNSTPWLEANDDDSVTGATTVDAVPENYTNFNLRKRIPTTIGW
jgi:hypothetical protein